MNKDFSELSGDAQRAIVDAVLDVDVPDLRDEVKEEIRAWATDDDPPLGQSAPVDAVVMRRGLPAADAVGAYWWYKPASAIMPEVQALFVRWVRGAVRAVYGGQLVKVTEMPGEWCGPIPWPTCWDTCQHGVVDGDFCETCNR